MDSVLHKMFDRRHLRGFSIFLLAAHLVLTNACKNTRSDCSVISVSVQEGSSLDVPLNTSDTILDVCVWNSSTSRWENACHFSGQVCKPLLPYFKEHISLAKENFVLQSASRDSGRIYELLDTSGKCVASINVSVSDPGVTTYPPTSLPPGTKSPSK
ncbi:Beta-lactamase [Varanus komodoensis]|nr:Beta-lactamase [Varanus komodoensis]